MSRALGTETQAVRLPVLVFAVPTIDGQRNKCVHAMLTPFTSL